MATFTVTNLNDTGAGSLRQAIIDANAGVGADLIQFASGLTGTLTLTSGQLSLTDDVIIHGDTTGDNKADITISGGNTSRIFSQSGAATDVVLSSLTLTNGFDASFGGGGAIYANSGSLLINDTTLQNNTSAGKGGAIYTSATTLTINNSALLGNTAIRGGGLYSNGNATTTISNTTIDGNSATGSGGGIYVDTFNTLNLINSTVTGNRSDSDGDGIGNGGGIHRFSGATALNITNSVVADNLVGTGATENDVNGTINTATNSVFGTGVTITAATAVQQNVADVGLGLLQDNGGTVQTRNINNGSVLINAGTNAGVTATDANGNDRTVAGTVDVGATEYQLVVTTLNDVVNAADGLLSLREAVAIANANADTDVITFKAGLAGQITLTGGKLELLNDVTIDGDINGDNKADITISGNNASGIFYLFGNATDVVLNSLTLTNGFVGNFGDGGAIDAVGGSLLINDSTLQNNTATGEGGAIRAEHTTLTINNSSLLNNTAGLGGALHLDTGFVTTTISNTTINGNSAVGGGGIWLGQYNSLNLNNSTVTNNIADSVNGGGGITFQSNKNSLNITNSVVADNFSGAGTVEDDVDGPISTATNSVFGTAVSGVTNGVGGNLTNIASVGLGEVLDNGGTVLTRSPLDGSILIGAGSNAALPLDTFDIDGDGNVLEVLPLDGRGGVRIVGITVDIGAVEQIINETIRGTAAANVILGGLGNDLISGLAGGDTLNGGTNTAAGDTVSYAGSNAAVTVNLGGPTQTATGGHATGDVISNFENITGSSHADGLTGNTGANVLDGGADALADTLTGGLGNDTYIIRSATDVIVEAAGGGAGDRAKASVSFTLAADDNIEFLETTNAAGVGLINLTGNANAQTITGNAGNNILNGGVDALSDTLAGGLGDDTYIINTSTDLITEFVSSGTADAVKASVSFTLANDDYIDIMQTTDAALLTAINLTGNGIRQVITGNAGANILNGGVDLVSDTLVGGLGDDTYIINTSTDLITEFVAGGTADVVQASVSFALANDDYIETLQTTNAALATAINLTGNSVTQTIIGNAGANILNGMFGKDTLTGGLGADSFLFNTALNAASNRDTITDFNLADDTIQLENTGIFTALGAAVGVLNVTMFKNLTTGGAVDATDRILYDDVTGALSYDADGNGATSAIQFATLTGAPTVTSVDFFVV